MKKYKLVNIGPSRSSTTSLFSMLLKHPNVAHLKKKEIMNMRNYKQVIDNYIFYFKNFNSKTKILLDGSTNYFTNYFINYFLLVKEKEYIENIKYIHIVRNPLDRIRSLINFLYYKNSINNEYENVNYLKRDKIDKDINKDMFIAYYMLYSNMSILTLAESILGKENILVLKFNNIDKKQIYTFCDIDYYEEEFEKTNKSYEQFAPQTNYMLNRILTNSFLNYLELEKHFIKEYYNIII